MPQKATNPTPDLWEPLIEEYQTALNSLLTELKIDNYDYLIVGDGSGSSRHRGAGWAATLIERVTNKGVCFQGAVNLGTVNFSEIMAYLQSLAWLVGELETRRQIVGPHQARLIQVHIVTDSEYCKTTGNRLDIKQPGKNGALWAAFGVMARTGLKLHWHWLRRDTNAFNAYADHCSRQARLYFGKFNV